MAVWVKTPPTIEPVTLADAKAHLNVDIADDDSLIASLLSASRGFLEEEFGRAFITQTLQVVFDAFPADLCSAIELPRPPLQSVSSITYVDANGVSGTVASADYFIDQISAPGRVAPKPGKSWPGNGLRAVAGVTVEYVAGYGDAQEDIPPSTKQAILLLLGHWYLNREPVGEAYQLDFALNALLGQNRIGGVA